MTDAIALTRGERNNDPGNLNFIPLGRAFNGELAIEPALPDGAPGRFGVYDTMFDGVRAAAEEVLIKVLEQHLTTTDALIGDSQLGWAPASDGNFPAAYSSAVATYVNASFDSDGAGGITRLTDLTGYVVSPSFLQAITGGIFCVENGHYPVGLAPADHLAACQSALIARGLG